MDAQTTVSNSTQCGLFTGEYKKYTLSGVTFSFKLHTTPQEALRSILLLCTNKGHYYFCRTYLKPNDLPLNRAVYKGHVLFHS